MASLTQTTLNVKAMKARSMPRAAGIRAPFAQAMYYHRKLAVVALAAEADEAVAEEAVVEEVVAAETSATESWAVQKLAELEIAENVQAEDASFALNFLWLDKNIGVAIDQVFGRGQRSPVTEYFFWPRKDAWEELKAALEAKPWIPEREKVLLLNKCTEVINYWQDETKHSVSEAQAKFPEASFAGTA